MDLGEAHRNAIVAMDEQRGNYFWEPIPVPLDGVLRDFTAAFARADARSQRQVAEQLTRRQRTRMTSFGVRAASMAVREQDPELLVLGLVAQWLGWPGVEDPRERVMSLAPMYQAAMKLEARPAEVFDNAATAVHDEEFRDLLRALDSRPEAMKSLAAVGYREVTGPDGLRFEPGGMKW
jgi:hypothetical protein